MSKAALLLAQACPLSGSGACASQPGAAAAAARGMARRLQPHGPCSAAPAAPARVAPGPPGLALRPTPYALRPRRTRPSRPAASPPAAAGTAAGNTSASTGGPRAAAAAPRRPSSEPPAGQGPSACRAACSGAPLGISRHSGCMPVTAVSSTPARTHPRRCAAC